MPYTSVMLVMHVTNFIFTYLRTVVLRIGRFTHSINVCHTRDIAPIMGLSGKVCSGYLVPSTIYIYNGLRRVPRSLFQYNFFFFFVYLKMARHCQHSRVNIRLDRSLFGLVFLGRDRQKSTGSCFKWKYSPLKLYGWSLCVPHVFVYIPT